MSPIAYHLMPFRGASCPSLCLRPPSTPHASSPSGNGHNNGLSTSPTNPTSPINKESGRALDDAPPKLDDAAPKPDDEPPKSPVAQSALEVGGD